jgi:hypothetical protein
MVIPTGATDQRMTTAKRQTLGDFLYYSLCAGQTKAGPYGYSPLPLNLVQAGFEQIGKLKAADPAVDLTDRDVKSCNNPTFDGKDLSKNKLAEIAPQPAACDKAGEGPCGTETGTNTPSTDDGTVTPGVTVETPGAPTGTDGGTAPPAAPGDGAAPAVDPDTGEVVASSGGTTTEGQAADFAAPTELASGRPTDSATFGWVAAVLLVALVLLPGLMVSSFRRRAQGGPR